ncbi:Serine/threonine protein kinase [Moritella sp. JT01]|uniref:serine/threonine-protein kinase n=1 Tax=Moritella sp. JT01 TaxID=756698 RepID=UPI0007959350|nr:serine/threonine-protein kinase [Moritella sp. JT01]KXO08344.1 Serine/threonine protein kinase [Moritella sp. JT01]
MGKDKMLLGNKKSKNDIDTATLTGQVLKNRYELEAHIGSGGMSDIYKAKDLLLDKAGVEEPYVAIKVLQPQYTRNKEAQQLLFREAHKTMSLSHPNIIRVYDVDKEDNLCFIIMEWLNGETLDQVISRSKPKGLTYKGAEKVISQVADALKFAHKNGIVHTDLKPSNIMLTRNGDIKIFDFGVARLIQNKADEFANDNIEQNNSLSGYTPAYASAELLQGQQPSESDDLFSLGCIFYELLSSKHPYLRKPADQAITDKITVKKLTKLSNNKWKVIYSALQLSNADRPQSIQAWQSKLTRKPLPVFSTILPLLTILGSVGYFYYMENVITTQQLTEQVHTSNVDNLANSSVEVFMNSLSELDGETATIKAGILRLKREEVINFHIAKINRIMQDPKSRYPDFDQMAALIKETITLYPDSIKLTDIELYVEDQRESARAILLASIEQRLLRANYLPDSDGTDIFTLRQDMKQVDTDYKIIPSEQAVNLYRKQLRTAVNDYNYNVINTLLAPGELLFKDSASELQTLLDQPVLITAIKTLTDYQASDKSQAFPFDAAELFYRDRFDTWIAAVKMATSQRTLDQIYNQQDTYNKSLPVNFKPLIKLRRDLANRYLKLIVTGKIKSGSKVIQKAESLLTKADKGQENLI